MRVLDLTDRRFGRLQVLEQGSRSRSGRIRWKCRCDCGNENVVERTSLTSGATRSCGCLAREKKQAAGKRRVKDLVGQRFGRWEVLERDATPRKTRNAYWKCRCDCGVENSVSGSALRKGDSQSCGCLARELASERYRDMALPAGVAAFNELFSRYKRQAQRRGITFKLDRVQFKALVEADCHYCGTLPSQVVQARYGRNGGITYNGVDRQDNDRAYEDGNVVPCCGFCNRAKSDLSVDEFLGWARRVVSRAEA